MMRGLWRQVMEHPSKTCCFMLCDTFAVPGTKQREGIWLLWLWNPGPGSITDDDMDIRCHLEVIRYSLSWLVTTDVAWHGVNTLSENKMSTDMSRTWLKGVSISLWLVLDLTVGLLTILTPSDEIKRWAKAGSPSHSTRGEERLEMH